MQIVPIDEYREHDRKYLEMDRQFVLRTKNIRLVPSYDHRKGGKIAYGEWCHVIGLFQALMYLHLEKKSGNRIIDAGCGTGLLAIAAEPFIQDGGRYTGIEISAQQVDYCRQHYPADRYEFKLLPAPNAAYVPGNPERRRPWDVESGCADMVTALSVWTHFNEDDAIFYFKEVGRALKPGGRAVITFFLLDETYLETLPYRTQANGRYHRSNQMEWVFEQPTSASGQWFKPKWARVPEAAIGLTQQGMAMVMKDSGMKQTHHYMGNWKEVPGFYFQDVVVFEKE